MPALPNKSVSDLWNDQQIAEYRRVFEASKEGRQQDVVRWIKKYWQAYRTYVDMAFDQYDALVSMPEAEYIKLFITDYPYQTSSKDSCIEAICSDRIASSIALHLGAPIRVIQPILFKITHSFPLPTTEDLARIMITRLVRRENFEGAWAVVPFWKECCKFVKGNGKTNYCKGLVTFLRQHMEWQDNPECDEWINSVDACIQKAMTHTARNHHGFKQTLWRAFCMKDFVAEKNMQVASNGPNVGRWIRL